jgi:hypothetical protein
MSSSKIDALKSTLGMGARANKYRVIINGVGGGPTGPMVDTLTKNASIPGRSFAEVEIWNQGKLTVIAGDAQFTDTWSVTFMDTEDHTLRGQFIAWMEFIDSVATNSRGAGAHSDYMTTAELQQLSTIDNACTATYKFEDLWPKSISDSTVSDDSSDMIEFTVEFNYTSWAKI